MRSLIAVQLKMALCAGEVNMTLKAHTALSVNFALHSGAAFMERRRSRRKDKNIASMCMREKERDTNNSCTRKVLSALSRVIFRVAGNGLGGYRNLC